MSQNHQLYFKFYAAFKKAHPKLSGYDCEVKVHKIWNTLKEKDNFNELVHLEIRKWTIQAQNQTLKLEKFWMKFSTAPPTVTIEKSLETSGNSQKESSLATSSSQNKTKTIATIFKAPAQDELNVSIRNNKVEILYLTNKRSQDIASSEELDKLRKLNGAVKSQEKMLKSKLADQLRQQQKRQRGRKHLAEIHMNHPELAELLPKKRKTGRPRCEDDQPELLKAIVDIATYGSGADQKRRTDMIRSMHTLDELTAQLNSEGFKVKRGAVYLRLLPRCSLSTEGKRHIITVPVKLARATNDLHHEHVDTKFCSAAISYLEEIASVLLPSEVLWISQDDKALVPIGKTAANKQTPLVMHLEYRVQLPDHDWVVAEKHKLIPSVYAFVNIESEKYGHRKSVTFSGPAFTTTRSAKHCSSNAYSHAKDFQTLMNLTEFEDFCKDDKEQFRPIIMITSDGGPDENPRFENVINCAISHFKKFDLDALFIATNAPGRSAFNRVERRMAPISRDLAGLILDHQKLGPHLNGKGETIDVDLEKKNFEAAGKTLAEIWSETVIDKFPTIAKYVSPEDSELEVETPLASWKSSHVRESHYFLQIVKCSDRNCCSAPRSSYFNLLDRFIPAPMCIVKGSRLDCNSNLNNKFPSLFLRKALDGKQFRLGIQQEIPFDTCCPSLKDVLAGRTCICGIYHGSKKSLASHQRICNLRKKNALEAKTNPRSIKKNVPEPTTILQPRIRPIRLAAMRQGQKMVVWKSRLNAEHVDWFDDNDGEIDVSSLELPTLSSVQDVMPTYDLNTRMKNPWDRE